MKYRLLHGGLIATALVLAVFLVFHATNVGGLFYRSSQPNRPASALRSFEIVPLETASETSSNASIGDLNGDGHLDIVLVKGRHWQLTSRVFFGQRSRRLEFRRGPGRSNEREPHKRTVGEIWKSAGNQENQYSKLRNTQGVAIRVLEPGYPCAARRFPDTKLVLLHPLVAFETHTSFFEFLSSLNNVRHLPA